MKPDIFKMYMSKLCASLIFDLPEKSMAEYFKHLQPIPDDQFSEICEKLCVDFQPAHYKRFPSISDFTSLRAQILRRINESATATLPDGIASPAESRAFLRVLEEIKRWHSLKLVEFNQDSCPPMGLEEWHRAGRPRTWSPCLDHLFSKLSDDPGGRWYAQICDEYCMKLKTERLKRMADKQSTEEVKNESD